MTIENGIPVFYIVRETINPTKHMQVNIKTTLVIVAAKFWVLFNIFGLYTLPEIKSVKYSVVEKVLCVDINIYLVF